MKTLRSLFIGMVAGLILGFVLAEAQHRREEKQTSDAFNSDPDIIALRKAWQREEQTEKWLGELDDSD